MLALSNSRPLNQRRRNWHSPQQQPHSIRALAPCHHPRLREQLPLPALPPAPPSERARQQSKVSDRVSGRSVNSSRSSSALIRLPPPAAPALAALSTTCAVDAMQCMHACIAAAQLGSGRSLSATAVHQACTTPSPPREHTPCHTPAARAGRLNPVHAQHRTRAPAAAPAC